MTTHLQQPVPAGVTPAPLPVHEYQQRLAITQPKAWRGIVALVLLMVGLLMFSVVFTGLGILVDLATGRWTLEQPLGMTPAMLAGGMAGLALLLPWSMLLQRWFFGVPMRSLHSLAGTFRWGLVGRTAAIVIPIWAVYLALTSAMMPFPATDHPVTDLLALFVIALTITPLQSAGEEYAFRGLVFRIAASWGRGPRLGLILGIAVSSLLFMVAHIALDPWLNLYYLTFGAALAVITWRTGGVELAVMLHAVNNSLAFVLSAVLSADLKAGLDRSVGAGSALMLIPCGLFGVIAAITWWRTRQGAVRLPAETRPALTE